MGEKPTPNEHSEVNNTEIPRYRLELSAGVDVSQSEVDRLNLMLDFVSSAPNFLVPMQQEGLSTIPVVIDKDAPVDVSSDFIDSFLAGIEEYDQFDADLSETKPTDELNNDWQGKFKAFLEKRKTPLKDQGIIPIPIENLSQYEFIDKQVRLAKHDVSSGLRVTMMNLQMYQATQGSEFIQSSRTALENISKDIAAAQEILDPEFAKMTDMTYSEVMDIFRRYKNPTNTIQVVFPENPVSSTSTLKTSKILLERFWRNILVNAEEQYVQKGIQENRTVTVSVNTDGDRDELRFGDRAGGFEETFITWGFARGKRGNKEAKGTGVAMRTINDLFKFQKIDIALENTPDEPKGGVIILRFDKKPSSE